jgi:hypothetical protein
VYLCRNTAVESTAFKFQVGFGKYPRDILKWLSKNRQHYPFFALPT